MKLKKMLMIFVVLLLTVSAQAATTRDWDGGGADDRWLTAANWDSDTIPAGGEIASLDEPGGTILIETGDEVSCTKIFGPSRTSAGVTTFTMTGGTLSNPSYWYFGYTAGSEGIVNIQGGTITTRDLGVGRSGGLGTVNMTGGTLNITGASSGLGLLIPGDATGTGNVYVSAGTLTTGYLTMLDYGLLDIGTDALVRITGDVRARVNGYIAEPNEYIIANGGTATVVVNYDGVYTTLQSSLNPALAKASAPSPVTGFTNVSPANVVLSWTPGVSALSHNVYFGTDSANLTLVSSEQAGTTYDAGNLNYTTTYYWRIDEVQSGGVITGDQWQFKTKGSITVDYFETYADTNSLKLVWKDGSADNSSGSSIILGNTSRDTTGSHSCYLSYDNTGAIGGKYYSEIERTPPLNDFLVINAKSMDIWYKGIAGNSVQKMYVALSDGTNTASVDVNSVASQESSVWGLRHIALSEFTDANPSLNLHNVTKMYIGIGDKTATSSGGTGTVYVDYISLWPSRCLTEYASDLNNDCKVDFLDFAQMATEWLANGMWPL